MYCCESVEDTLICVQLLVLVGKECNGRFMLMSGWYRKECGLSNACMSQSGDMRYWLSARVVFDVFDVLDV